MSSIILCNTGADSLSQINLDNYDVRIIPYDLSEKPIGAHGIMVYKDKIYTANNYSDSVSIFDGITLKEEKNIKIGPKPNDLIIVNKKLYVICGESNAIVVYDLEEERGVFEIHTGNWPHSIDFSPSKELFFVSNLDENSVTVIGLNTHDVLMTLLTPEYPTKVRVSNNNKFLYVCESYLGSGENGYLEVFSLDSFNSIKRVVVGTSPIDMYEDESYIYVSNFTDGSISIIDKNGFTVKKTIYVGGMPKCILKYNNNIYICDYLKDKLIVLEDEKIKKVIAIESEPNAMTIF